MFGRVVTTHLVARGTRWIHRYHCGCYSNIVLHTIKYSKFVIMNTVFPSLDLSDVTSLPSGHVGADLLAWNDTIVIKIGVSTVVLHLYVLIDETSPFRTWRWQTSLPAMTHWCHNVWFANIHGTCMYWNVLSRRLYVLMWMWFFICSRHRNPINTYIYIYILFTNINVGTCWQFYLLGCRMTGAKVLVLNYWIICHQL